MSKRRSTCRRSPILKLTSLGLCIPLLLTGATLPTIALNQVGFLPNAAKRGILSDPRARSLPWQVTDHAGRVVLRGRTRVFGSDPASGDHVHRIDLSPIQLPGRFLLRVRGAAPQPFTVATKLFRPIARAALNFFYQSRAGTPIEARFAGGTTWARAAGHPHEVAACFSGRDGGATTWPSCPYRLDVTGGWYDAGDHGKYVVNGGIAVWTLQNLYEANAGRPPFPDGSAALPEAGNGRNDLLDEARWEMRFLLRMQVPDGAMLALPLGSQAGSALRLTRVDAGGMAYHKVADRNWTPLPTIPAEDPEERLLFPPSTAATLNLAATAAQCARVWRVLDPAFAQRCLVAAERAYAAARRHPNVLAAQAFTGSGGYGDDALGDELYWATAELYATTGRPALATELHAMPEDRRPLASEPGWSATATLGAITLATAPGVPAAKRARARARLIALARRFADEEARSGYAIPYATLRYPWGSNGAILNRGIVLALAARFSGERRLRDAAIDTVDYVLGRNPLGRSFVSGFGTDPMRNPHHRFWAHQFDARLPGPPPGALSGGANNSAFADPVSATLKGRCAPQRCWLDDARAFADNEVAINWNAPLVWMASWLDAGAR